MTDAIAKDLAKVFEEKGGFTALPGTGSLISAGYAVSRPETEFKLPLHNGLSHFVELAIKTYAELEEEKLSFGFLGAWLDGENIVLDVTDIVFERQEAISLAQARGQKAIYNYNKAHVEWIAYPEDCM